MDWQNIIKVKIQKQPHNRDELGYIIQPAKASVLDTIFNEIIRDNMVHILTVFFDENKEQIHPSIRRDVEKMINHLSSFETDIQAFLDKYDESYGGDPTKLNGD